MATVSYRITSFVENLRMLDSVYVCPVACHRDVSERLLIMDPDGSWFLWMGDCGIPELIEIPRRLAGWIAVHPHMIRIAPLAEAPHMWFDISSLPVTPVPTERAGRSPS